MRKIKLLFILCLIILIVFFKFAVRIDENNKNEKVLNNKKQMKEILSIIKLDLNQDVLYGDIKLVDATYIKNNVSSKKLIKKINKYEFNGCFKIGKGKLKYFDISCDKYIIDKTISANPAYIENLIPARYENGKYIKTNYINWYNYDKQKFAYAIISDDTFRENEVIVNDKIKNIFVWIPAFYYNEEKKIISYKPIGNTSNHYKYTTHNYLPFAFFFKNDDIYGFWLKLDNNKLPKITEKDNIDVHHITDDEMFAINLFKKYYDIENYFLNIENSIVISVGRGKFFNEKD